MRAGPVSMSDVLGSLRQNQRSLGHMHENTVLVVDHLGKDIPVPISFCSTWEVRIDLSACHSAHIP
jgi:hypothetical protein